jgi:hypothetical protein
MAGVDDLRRLEAKGLARAKIRAKRRRVSTIRGRTIRGSLLLFAVAWAIVFGQLATGNDPALSKYGGGPHKLFVADHGKRPGSSRPQPVEKPEEEEEGEGEAVLATPVEAEAPPEEAAPELAPEPVITSSS